MALYQRSVLSKYLKQLETSKVDKAYKKYANHFLNPTIQENIRNSKEEEYQGIFLTDLFVNILDYTLKPIPNFNLVAEYKNETNTRKADGAILIDNKAIGVIELKGTKTKDLESITKQAFGYKNNQKECVYVITSNYEKLRFYINDATEFEEFNLFELTREEFDLLYLCLQKDNIENNIPLKIKEASLLEEEQITKKFYKDYSLFKRELYRDLVKRNTKRIKSNLSKISTDTNEADLDEETKADLFKLEKNVKLNLFKKSQKLIDRFLFVFFAEDRGLLPPNSTLQILNKWKADVDFGDDRPLYDMFKQYFKFLDTGRQGTTNRAEIYAYNGGLFKEDIVLDQLEIDNDLLFNHTKTLAAYDFESQVDVNILGHIFENSLNEIESVNAEIEGGDFDKQKSKRKKDGVFYTPKYITKYIVENTIGKLCEEKKNELGFKEEEYFKGRKNRHDSTIVKLVDILDNYREWLLQLTICDPACGSGAFLNQALDFLIKEHNYIDELKAKILGAGLVFSDIENTILENNIYGVDLNEESVEIAKLSLWLRTAQPRRKLNSLNNNIKCGNSLIDSKTVAGDKAFNWKEQFPKVFTKGGFDVIIGNPPYVNVENLDLSVKKYLFDKYYSAQGRTDLYVLFVEKAIDIINNDGLMGLIIPYSFINQNYAQNIREKIVDSNHLISIVDTSKYFVFSDAIVKTIILIIGKENIKEKTKIYRSTVPAKLEEFYHEINQYDFLKLNKCVFETKPFLNLLEIKNKLENKSKRLENLCLVAYGVRVNSKFDKNKPKSYYVHSDNNLDYKKFIEGKDISRYFHNQTAWLNYQPDEHYNSMFPELFENEKLFFINVVSDRIRFSYDNDNLYNSHTVINCIKIDKLINSSHVSAKRIVENCDINLISKYDIKYILVILNSNLINWYFLNFLSEGLHFYPDDAKKLPIKEIEIENQSSFIQIADRMLIETKYFNNLNTKFTKYLQSQFAIEKLTKKLENWYDLEFGDFIKEINKAIKVTNKERVKNELQPIKELTKLDEMDWMDVFETKKAEAQNLKQQINTTDKEIDAMVYALYGLSEEEINIVENS
jgi:type I restriction-modification system DNA methylase subunit